MTKRSRNRFLLVSGTVPIILFAVLFAYSAPKESRLTDGAARLVTWEIRSPVGRATPADKADYAYASDYRWLSPTELVRVDASLLQKNLFVSVYSTKGVPVRRLAVNCPPMTIYPIATGPLSLDGKWLFYPQVGGFGAIGTGTGELRTFKRTTSSRLATMSAAQRTRALFSGRTAKPRQAPPAGIFFNPPEDVSNLLAWMPDSHRFIEVIRDRSKLAHLQVRSLADRLLKDIPLPATGTARLPRLLGITKGRKAVFINQTGYTSHGFFTVDLDAAGDAVQPLQVAQPPGTDDIHDIALSPDGDRLAWHTSTHNLSAGYRVGEWLGHLKDRREPKYLNAIWTSDLDGGRPRRLASELLSTREEADFRFVHWTPDDHHVSFMFKDALYSIDAPR